MRTTRTTRKLPLRRPALLPLAAVTVLAASSAPALADVGHDDAAGGKSAAQHGMSADEHARMNETPAPRTTPARPQAADDHGMTADEHAGMEKPEAPAPADGGHGDHDTTPAGDHDEHGAAPADEHGAAPADEHGATGAGDEAHAGDSHGDAEQAGDRPAGLVLAGFGLLNGLVILFAAVLRRRPDARKRRQTLARVRSTPPKQTVFPPASPAAPSSEEERS